MQPSMNSNLAEYSMIKSTAVMPSKIKYYFDSLESVLELTSPPEQLPHTNRHLIAGFSKLSLSEKARYLNESIKFVVKALLKKSDQKMPEDNNDIKLIETSAELSITTLKIPRWISVTFKLDKSKYQVALCSKKKQEYIYLQGYLIRKSKKYKGTIVFVGAAQHIKSDKQKIEISFKTTVVNEIYEELFQSMMACRNEELLRMIEAAENKDKGYTVFLSPKNINEYLTFKDQIIKNLLVGKLDFKSVTEHKENSSQIVVKQCNNMQKIFKSQSIFNQNSKELRRRVQEVIKKNKYCISSQQLERFSQRYAAIYERYRIEGRLLDLITIREQNNNSQQEEVLFIKGIKNIMTQNFLEFMWVKIRDLGDGRFKLLIICSINLSDSIRPEVVKNFLFHIHQLTHNKQNMKLMMQEGQDLQEQEEFHTVYGNSLGEEQFVQFIQAEEDTKNLNSLDIPKYTQQMSKHFQQSYLQHRYQLTPIQGFNIMGSIMKAHYLFPEWERQKNGLICTNEAIINEQKKMFKYVITTFGNNILKGGSILNISLPVTVFKKESHLKSIARDFCYAPMFFDGVKDALQRVKFATLLAISVGTLGISIDKPFNPILGETLQLWIGGCPIYLEQISHHPPIGSYLFIGRGYRIHGRISPKISFGMNNVKGYSQLPNHIIFDDGTQIRVSYGKMIINGILFGERSFNFDDQIFAYDKTNNIFSQINYGPKKKGMMSRNADPKDYCYGKIYSVKPEFRKKFQAESTGAYPEKNMILSDLSQFEGVWSESIRFDGQEKFNFKTQLPCELEQEKFPLPSNSSYRKDLQNLVLGNIQESQKQKQIGEEIQRRDRKLRQEHTKTKTK